MGLCTNQQIRFDPIIGLAVGRITRHPVILYTGIHQ